MQQVCRTWGKSRLPPCWVSRLLEPTQPLALSSSSSLSILLSRSHTSLPCEAHAFPPSALRSIAQLAVVTHACTAPCGLHVFPPSALCSIASVGRRHTGVSCYCSYGCIACLVMAAHHSCACTCFEMLLHPTTVKGKSAQGAQGRAYSSCRFHHKSGTRRL